MRWRFVDKALHFVPWEAILTLKAGSLEEYSLLERWGEPGRAPGLLALETCIQSARWLVEASSGFALTCDPVEIALWRAVPGLRPGERFCAFLRIDARDDKHVHFALGQKTVPPGEAPPGVDFWREARQTAGRLSCRLTPLERRCLPADRACLWEEIWV